MTASTESTYITGHDTKDVRLSCSYAQQRCSLLQLSCIYTHLYDKVGEQICYCDLRNAVNILKLISHPKALIIVRLIIIAGPSCKAFIFHRKWCPSKWHWGAQAYTKCLCVCVHYRDETTCERGLWAKRIMLQRCYAEPQGLSFCGRWNINKGLHSSSSEIGIWKETQKADRLSCVVIWRKPVSMNHLTTPQKPFFIKCSFPKASTFYNINCQSVW